jgi:hypothetical protein
MTQITIKNGTRVPVEFGHYTGMAAIDGDRVLFPADLRTFRRVKTGTVDGVAVTVTKIGRSAVVPALVEIQFRQEP